MALTDGNDEVKARLQKVEQQVRNAKIWLFVLGIGVLVALFGDTALRLWQINSACKKIVAEHPNLEHSECMKRVHEAWSSDQDTIRLD